MGKTLFQLTTVMLLWFCLPASLSCAAEIVYATDDPKGADKWIYITDSGEAADEWWIITDNIKVADIIITSKADKNLKWLYFTDAPKAADKWVMITDSGKAADKWVYVEDEKLRHRLSGNE